MTSSNYKNMDKQKIRIACFHGFGTNSDFMKIQMKHINKLLSKHAQCIYINGPYKVNPNIVEQAVTTLTENATLYSWFQYKSLTQSELFQESINNVVSILDKYGPFDGMIGFSQGGALVHFIVMLKMKGLLKHKYLENIKFCVFICSIWWNFKEVQTDMQMFDFPTLHLISPSDFTFRISSNSPVRYLNPIIMMHGEGHKIPRISTEDFMILIKFIKSAIQGKKVSQKLSRL